MMPSRSVLITASGLLALFLFWYQLPSSPQSGSPGQPGDVTRDQPRLQARISALEDALFAEQVKIRKLGERIALLETQSQQLVLALAQTANQPDAENMVAPPPSDAVTKTLKRPPTLQQKLLTAGLPEDTVQRIHQRIGENRLALLELRNRAIREDWMDTPEYIEQMQKLRNPSAGIREQEGDEVYDQYLYAAGRPNRVMVSEVYAGSAADQAGIQPHDIILSYAQKRIFSMRELQRATTEGIDGEMVLVELSRDGQRLSTSVSRGPLGIALTVTRLPPD